MEKRKKIAPWILLAVIVLCTATYIFRPSIPTMSNFRADLSGVSLTVESKNWFDIRLKQTRFTAKFNDSVVATGGPIDLLIKSDSISNMTIPMNPTLNVHAVKHCSSHLTLPLKIDIETRILGWQIDHQLDLAVPCPSVPISSGDKTIPRTFTPKSGSPNKKVPGLTKGELKVLEDNDKVISQFYPDWREWVKAHPDKARELIKQYV